MGYLVDSTVTHVYAERGRVIMKRLILAVIMVLFLVTQVFSGGYLDNWYHYEHAMRLISAKKWEQAEKELNYYLNHPEMHRHMFGVAHFGKGLMFQAMRRYDAAIKEYRMATENDLHPEVKVSESAYMNLGALYMRAKSYTDAAEAYAKIVQKNPQNGLAHYYLGLSYLRKGDYQNAEKEGEIAKKLGVQFTALQEDLAEIKETPKSDTEDMTHGEDGKSGKTVEKIKAE
jgi:tetratricopeptide (TPR) repeat protein